MPRTDNMSSIRIVLSAGCPAFMTSSKLHPQSQCTLLSFQFGKLVCRLRSSEQVGLKKAASAIESLSLAWGLGIVALLLIGLTIVFFEVETGRI